MGPGAEAQGPVLSRKLRWLLHAQGERLQLLRANVFATLTQFSGRTLRNRSRSNHSPTELPCGTLGTCCASSLAGRDPERGSGSTSLRELGILPYLGYRGVTWRSGGTPGSPWGEPRRGTSRPRLPNPGGSSPTRDICTPIRSRRTPGRLPRNVVGMRRRMATCDTGAVRQPYAAAPLAV